MTATITELPRSLFFSGNAPVDGLLSSLWMDPYVSGRQPHSCAVDLTEVAADATLLPPGTAADHTHDESGRRSHVASGPGWTLIALRRRAGSATVRVCATSPELARAITDQAAATTAAGRPAGADELPVGFWRRQACGGDGVRSPRRVTVPAWPDIRRNYGASAAPLDALMRTRPDTVTGRLVLLHGPSGTGKTTALRALTHEWRDWCQVDAVLDPEALFTDPGYLSTVVMGPPPMADEERRWRMLVLEDCDELVGAGAKQNAGQQLSRLLNLTDGMLGQGLDVLVCLTTNEDVGALHPAVVRPGRCLAEIEVGRLTRDEAARWLGTGDVPSEGASLAELYRLQAARALPSP